MADLKLGLAADADLVGIFAHGAETFGYEAADAYVSSFDTAFDLLRRHSYVGMLHAQIRPPIYGLMHRRHRIFYDIIDGVIVVQRILHMSMDIARHLDT